MTEYKKQKVAVVVITNTSIYPNTMMIEFHDANVAKTAVLRSSRLHKFAGTTLFTFFVENIIILKFSHRLFMIAFLDYTWISPASQ
jgi:hypothetical protein